MTNQYTALITSANQTPNFTQVVYNATQPYVDLQNMLNSINFNISTATGWELDYIGAWVGISRNINIGGVYTTLTDAQYRAFLGMQIIANSWNGTKESAYNALAALNLYAPGDLLIYDNQNMTMTICLRNTALKGFLIQLIVNGVLPLRPFAVLQNACTKQNFNENVAVGIYSTIITTLE